MNMSIVISDDFWSWHWSPQTRHGHFHADVPQLQQSNFTGESLQPLQYFTQGMLGQRKETTASASLFFFSCSSPF